MSHLWSGADDLLSKFLLLEGFGGLRDALKMLAAVLDLTGWVTATQGHVTMSLCSLIRVLLSSHCYEVYSLFLVTPSSPYLELLSPVMWWQKRKRVVCPQDNSWLDDTSSKCQWRYSWQSWCQMTSCHGQIITRIAVKSRIFCSERPSQRTASMVATLLLTQFPARLVDWAQQHRNSRRKLATAYSGGHKTPSLYQNFYGVI